MEKENDDSNPLGDFELACKIGAKAMARAKEIAKPGAKMLDVANELESLIREQGAQVAFPVNLSVNDSAAHYTPEFDSELLIGDKDLLKVDLGAHINGYPSDMAITLDFSGENGKLLEASEAALNNAIAMIKPGVKTNEIGKAIEATITGYGYKPIKNLSGHYLGQYELHTGIDVPNYAKSSGHAVEEGDIFAIEPFATNGAGAVADGNQVEIFSLLEKRPVRMRESRKLLAHAEQYKGLPFAERWLYPSFNSKLLLRSALKELALSGALHQYPVLKEVGGGLVSQFEATLVVEKDSARVLTK